MLLTVNIVTWLTRIGWNAAGLAARTACRCGSIDIPVRTGVAFLVLGRARRDASGQTCRGNSARRWLNGMTERWQECPCVLCYHLSTKQSTGWHAIEWHSTGWQYRWHSAGWQYRWHSTGWHSIGWHSTGWHSLNNTSQDRLLFSRHEPILTTTSMYGPDINRFR